MTSYREILSKAIDSLILRCLESFQAARHQGPSAPYATCQRNLMSVSGGVKGQVDDDGHPGCGNAGLVLPAGDGLFLLHVLFVM